MKMFQALKILLGFGSTLLFVSASFGQGQDGPGPGVAVRDHVQPTQDQPLEEEPLDFDRDLPLPGDTDPDLSDAVTVAERWLGLIDSHRLDAAWNSAADFFRERLSEDDWSSEVRASRQPLGALEARELDGSAYYSDLPPIVPEGPYAKLTFISEFAEVEEVLEVVTMMRGKDGDWIVAGYRIPE